jgi:hypothetical protein
MGTSLLLLSHIVSPTDLPHQGRARVFVPSSCETSSFHLQFFFFTPLLSMVLHPAGAILSYKKEKIANMLVS